MGDVARIGGDEFAAVKQFSEQPALLDFVARIEACISTTLTIPDDASDADELMTKSTIAMQRARAKGNATVCFYETSLDEAARSRNRLIADLWGAASRGEMSLAYQVQKSIRTMETIGYEALVRWQHPELGQIPPDTFMGGAGARRRRRDGQPARAAQG